jgi:diguanylate cyclase (GGDEF)-like protein/PAS domain S-box-containing protein
MNVPAKGGRRWRWDLRREKVTAKKLELMDVGTAPNDATGTFPLSSQTDDAQLEAALLKEQLRMLTDKWSDLAINMLNALIVSWIIRKLFPAWLIILWLTAFSVVILFRYVSRHRFQSGQYDVAAMRRWVTLSIFYAFAMGGLWGLTACVVLVTANPLYVVFIVFVLVGMMTGGIVVNSAYLPAMYGFLLPTIVPVIVALAVQQNFFHWALGGMVTVLTIIVVLAGRSINRSILNNVRLRIEQSLLTDQLRANERVMAEVQKMAQVGGLEITERGARILYTDEALRIIGVDRTAFKPDFETLIARVHKDDRARVTDNFNEFMDAGKLHDFDCRAVMDNGDVKYVRVVGQIIEKSQSSPLRHFVAIQDVTVRRLEGDKLKFANLLLYTQMEASPDGILVADEKRRIISSNQLFAKIWNISAKSIADGLDDPILAAVTSQQKDPVSFRERVKYLYDHPGEDDHDELATIDGRFIDRQSTTLFAPDGEYLGRVWFFRDITERKRAEEELAYRDRLLHAVTEGTRILVKAESPDQGMAEALRIVRESLQVDRVLVMQESKDSSIQPILRYSTQTRDIADVFEIKSFQPTPSEEAALTVWRTPLKDGKPVFGWVETAEAPVRRLLEWFHNKSTLMVPIFVGDRLWGSLAADSTSTTRKWTTTEINTLSTFGDMAGALIVQHESQVALQTSEERFRVLGDTAADAIIIMDGGGRISSWNRAAEQILGYTALEARGQDLHELLTPPRFLAKAVESMKEFHATGAGDEVGTTRSLIARRKDGVEIAIELSMAAARVGTEWQAIGILRDVTERRSMEAKLQFSNVLLTTEMDASLDGILVVDADRKVILSNRRFDEIWKTPKATIQSGIDSAVLRAGQAIVKDPEKFAALVEKLYKDPSTISDDEVEMLDGRLIERHTVPLTTDSGSYLGRAWFFRDVSERRDAEALAIRSAHFDVLTGLANRSVFVEAVDAAVARAKRGGSSFAVIYLDLDHFKDVNDTLGHPLGDALLMAVADRLISNTRALDTVARFGGDEFAMVLVDISGPADAATVAEKLNHALSVPYVIRGNQIYSAASIGIDIYGPNSGDAELLLSHADVALYRAKQGGGNSYRFFTETMDREVRVQVSLGTDLHEALEKNEFFLEYQPQVEVADLQIVGVEALVRWRHPSRGIITPDVFIPAAEKSGLILKLGTWVLQTACAQMKVWIDAGIKPVRLAVNVSSMQFKSPTKLEDDVIQALQSTGMPAHWLELELTETVLMHVTREHSEIMSRLRKLGITIALDDFGPGYSSLAYLRHFPIDRIKIDQDFVLHLGSEPGDASIVRATISLGRELGMAVIAEGIETAEQLALLTQWGCREVQGYYFARPLAVADITRLLIEGKIIIPEAAPKG